MKASFMLSGTRQTGKVVKRNKKTVWIKTFKGDIVKRHRLKHSVFVII